jgi:hypothetical protein
MKTLLAVVVGLLAALVGVTPAQAHNSFTGSNPKDGARLAQAPETVTLRFLATLDQTTTTVEVTGPGGVAAGAGKPVVKGSRVTVGVRPGAAGEYTVTYRVASRDGHPIKGKIRFTVTTAAAAPTTSAAAPAGANPTPVGAAVTSVSTASAVATPPGVSSAVADRGDEASWWPWLLGVATLVAIGLVAIGLGALLVRRRRST